MLVRFDRCGFRCDDLGGDGVADPDVGRDWLYGLDCLGGDNGDRTIKGEERWITESW